MKTLVRLLMLVALLAAPTVALAGGEGLTIPDGLDKKIALEGLSGLNLWLAKIYNENLILYAAVCTVAMAVVGMAIALVTDVILKAMGMEVHKIEHRE